MDQSGTHIVGIELSFLEKLGWLLKEAKRVQDGRPRASYKDQENHSYTHGLGKTREQDLIGDRLAINAILKNETRLIKRKQNKARHPPIGHSRPRKREREKC